MTKAKTMTKWSEHTIASYWGRMVQLEKALENAADRLERAVLAGGSSPEYAALAVKEYRDLLTDDIQPNAK